MALAPQQRRWLHDNGGSSKVTMVAKPQWWGLNDNGGGSTMTAAAQQQWWRLHDNSSGQPTIDGLSTMMAAAPQQRWHLYNDGGGSRLPTAAASHCLDGGVLNIRWLLFVLCFVCTA